MEHPNELPIPAVVLTQPGGQPQMVSGILTTSSAAGSPGEIFPALSPRSMHSSGSADSPLDEKYALMKSGFEESSRQNFPTFDGYNRVGVLIIKWEKGLDQLLTHESGEVDRLKALFEDTFNFDVEVLELENAVKPQWRLRSQITNFLGKYDHEGVKNLVIVYYTGHGSWDDAESKLYLDATDRWQKKRGVHSPSVCWNDVEDFLVETSSDVLAIFDCCFASNLMLKGTQNHTKTFEMLSASGIWGKTRRPGPLSFTSALIESIQELCEQSHDKSFSTFHLNQTMNLKTIVNPPHLWNRQKVEDRHIRIAPVVERRHEQDTTNRTHAPGAVVLTLSFELADKKEIIERDQIDDLTRNMHTAFRNSRLELKCVDFKGLRPRRLLREAVGRVMVAANRFAGLYPSLDENGRIGHGKRRQRSSDPGPYESMAKRQRRTSSNSETIPETSEQLAENVT